ncbi:MAG TPA: signal peptide peptidase SppA, partial [Bacteroidia bacterium]|nr:signal peptide peptidase SppA [Bacteroidia bacterium]
YAAKKANVKEYKISELPRPKNPFENIFGKVEADAETNILEKNLGPLFPYMKSIQQVLRQKGVQARMPFEILIQ